MDKGKIENYFVSNSKTFGTLEIDEFEDIFIATIITDSEKLSTGRKGLVNFYIYSGGGIMLYETTYNGMILNGEEKDKFYKQIISEGDMKKANENLRDEINRLFGNEH